YLFVLLFLCSAPPRHLHSFPTRRSSDLLARRRLWRAARPRPAGLRAQPARGVLPASRSPPADRAQAQRQRRPSLDAAHQHSQPRSEEHTSELQSPCNLVCRLLLEKKNKN